MSTKKIQGKLWSIAPSYWAHYFEPYFIPMYKHAIDQLNLTDKTLLLDTGCGAGLFSTMAIKAGANVIGIDAAPGLLEVARRRNSRNDFLEEDMEALPFGDESFNVVTAFNSFQYAGDFQHALNEAKRVLIPGGRLVIGIWDKPEFTDSAKVLMAITSLLPPPPVGIPGPFALSEDGKIEGICNGIGLKVLYKTKVACPFLYSTVSAGIKSFMGTGPAAAALNHTDKDTLEATIAKALQPFNVTDSFYFLQNNLLLFIAEKQLIN